MPTRKPSDSDPTVSTDPSEIEALIGRVKQSDLRTPSAAQLDMGCPGNAAWRGTIGSVSPRTDLRKILHSLRAAVRNCIMQGRRSLPGAALWRRILGRWCDTWGSLKVTRGYIC